MADKGGGGSTTTSTQKVNVTTNVTGPPINIAVGSDFLAPVAKAFEPVSQGISKGLDVISGQTQNLANQTQSVLDFTQRSAGELNQRQDKTENMIQMLVLVLIGAAGIQLLVFSRK